jgi:hypothetical protein
MIKIRKTRFVPMEVLALKILTPNTKAASVRMGFQEISARSRLMLSQSAHWIVRMVDPVDSV